MYRSQTQTPNCLSLISYTFRSLLGHYSSALDIRKRSVSRHMLNVLISHLCTWNYKEIKVKIDSSPLQRLCNAIRHFVFHTINVLCESSSHCSHVSNILENQFVLIWCARIYDTSSNEFVMPRTKRKFRMARAIFLPYTPQKYYLTRCSLSLHGLHYTQCMNSEKICKLDHSLEWGNTNERTNEQTNKQTNKQTNMHTHT